MRGPVSSIDPGHPASADLVGQDDRVPIQPEPFADDTLPHRFFNLKQVAAMLATSEAQVYALVRAGDLPAIKIGGRGQWRVEGRELDRWIEAQYVKTQRLVRDDAFDNGDPDDTHIAES